MSNLGFEDYLKEILGVDLIRTAVGDVNVINEMQRNSYSLGGEQSGHSIFSNYLPVGDGLLTTVGL